MWAVVVGHFSTNGKLQEQHFNIQTEPIHNFISGDFCNLVTEMVDKFSYEGHFVVDATESEG